jgi:N-acyl-phosphatidylethanolamine-hydrolysing phospholipase D
VLLTVKGIILNLHAPLLEKKGFFSALTGLIFTLVLPACSVAETFSNTNPNVGPKSLGDVIEWRLTKDSSPARVAIEVSDEWRNLTPQSHPYAIWIGHATYLIDTGDVTILTDPIFSDRASPVSWAGPERLIPPAMSVQQLPKIDAVLISHNHYDHLDLPSLKLLQKNNPNMVILAPQGDKELLDSQGLNYVSEFRWWQNTQVKQTEFTFTPVQHWSGRGITGRNTSLWGGWFLKSPALSLYHAGDTGYSKDFVATQERLGTPDFAFIPIGAYKPRWFMKGSHIDPAEAVQVALDLQVTKSFGMHWGTFVLTDEKIKEPRKLLAEALIKRQLAPDFFVAPKPGAILKLVPKS